MPDPFLVLATQNPIETEGTYPLPEAQVDRFMLKVLVGYPSNTEEFVIVERMIGHIQPVHKVLTSDQLLRLQQEADNVYVDPALIEYAVRIVTTTRHPEQFGLKKLQPFILFGASPRASINCNSDGPRPGIRARAQLRPATRCTGHGAGCDPASNCSLVRGAFRQYHLGRAVRRDTRPDPTPGCTSA